MNAKLNPPSDPPNGLGWIPVIASVGDTVCEDDPCIFARLVADEPAKEAWPEHPAGPKPDPGEGYRLLSKDPPEELQEGDELQCVDGIWGASANARTHKRQGPSIWYRRKIGFPANEPEPPASEKPAWEPKVGDWVRVTRPERPEISDDTPWLAEMDRFHGKVMQVARFWEMYQPLAVILAGTNYAFKVDWLSPAEPPAIDKPEEPEYREPVLPADAGKVCEFSDDGQRWLSGWVYGWVPGRNWVTLHNNGWAHARIKKDA